MDDTKLVAIQFLGLNDSETTRIRSFVNRRLLQKTAILDVRDLDGGENRRADVRVMLMDLGIRMVTEATKSLPSLDVEVKIKNLSAGGMLIELGHGIKVVKDGVARFYLNFIEPPVIAKGRILGRRRKAFHRRRA